MSMYVCGSTKIPKTHLQDVAVGTVLARTESQRTTGAGEPLKSRCRWKMTNAFIHFHSMIFHIQFLTLTVNSFGV